ncbi:hypothetical protein [Brevundimonas sp.]|uniref:hypothetical protein n=1 Tax=Brevundimonas sp. TaxID=1871086 RepID=UPI002897D5BB|nr:hypothetical protein [Brevundimonas sp.]
MSVTYTDQVSRAAAGVDHEAYVPVYARNGARKSNKPVKTWMILAPLGVLVLGGAAAAMLMQPAEPAALATVEVAPSAVTPEVSPLTAATIPMQTPAELTTATPIPPAGAAPVERRMIPAPARASAPLARAERAAPAPVEPAVEPVAPIVSPGPQPYLSGAPQIPAATPSAPAPATPAAPPAPIVITPPN